MCEALLPPDDSKALRAMPGSRNGCAGLLNWGTIRLVSTEYWRLVFRYSASMLVVVAMLNGFVPLETRGQVVVADSTNSAFSNDPDYLAARQAFARLDYSAANKLYGRVAKKHPRSAEIRIALASLALLRSKPQEALKHAAKLSLIHIWIAHRGPDDEGVYISEPCPDGTCLLYTSRCV